LQRFLHRGLPHRVLCEAQWTRLRVAESAVHVGDFFTVRVTRVW
jgi:hypothetical protein